MHWTHARVITVLAATLLLVSACAAGPNNVAQAGADNASFWLGLWQGLIALYLPDCAHGSANAP
jgi:hypothetical protein